MAKRRSSGSTRQLPSGRWQARVRDVDGRLLTLGSFGSRAEAERAITLSLADQTRGGWIDPRAGRVLLDDFAHQWLDSRPQPLRPRTRELYEYLLRTHILPALGGLELGKLTTSRVRRWNANMQRAGRGQAVTARAYRLLRAILSTAVEDELIVKNPCTIKGAGTEHAPERPVASVAQVFSLAAAVDPRFRALVLAAAFTSLREAELFGLRRRHVDLSKQRIKVVEQLHSMSNGTVVAGPPKTDAGRRTVSIPEALIGEFEAHLDQYTGTGPEALVFCGAKGAPLRRSYWTRRWREATAVVGMPGFHFHDLRHTGNTLAAATGASTKELMARMGHASPRAALIYQHATRERDEAIARALSAVILAAPTAETASSAGGDQAAATQEDTSSTAPG